MKNVAKDKHLLHVLKNTKCNKFRTAILRTCNDKFIQTLSEIVHNILSGNIQIDPTARENLTKFKSKLKFIHSELKRSKSKKLRRKLFINQKGGFWIPLLTAALSALVDYGVKKFTQN